MAGKADKKEKEKKGQDDLSQMSMEELAQTKRDIETLIASLEDEYRKAGISEASYKEAKEKNQRRLEQARKLLEEWGYSEPPAAASPPAAAAAAHVMAATATAQLLPDTVPPPRIQAAPPGQAYDGLQRELIESRMKIETERLKAMIDAVKESKQATDERIQRVTESIGEIRSLVFQREGAMSQQELKVKKLEEMIGEVKPQEIAKEFGKRDKTIAQEDLRLEKLEKKLDEVARAAASTQVLIKGIGGLENIATLNREMSQKTAGVSETAKRIDRLSDKIEKIFVELNKNLGEFVLYKTKQDTMDELVKDMLKSLDGLTIKLEGYVQKEDMNLIKADIAALSGKLDEVGKLIDMIIPVVKLKLPDTIQGLKKEKEDIDLLLASLEETYKRKGLSRREYVKARETNLQKLGVIDEQLKKEWQTLQSGDNIAGRHPIGGQETGQQEQAKEKAAGPAEKPQPKQGKGNPAAAATGLPQETVKQPKEAAAVPGKPTSQQQDALNAEEAKPDGKDKEADKTATATTQDSPGQQAAANKEQEGAAKAAGRKERLLADLKDSLDRGLISREAYERAREMVENS
ncbi:MAG: hypothetical protein HY367_01690 [Candidatus Aenigmarchaeota archaeon]|nr:hypothetical protein [Candidatus Aenigmarchaeota archaeon]